MITIPHDLPCSEKTQSSRGRFSQPVSRQGCAGPPTNKAAEKAGTSLPEPRRIKDNACAAEPFAAHHIPQPPTTSIRPRLSQRVYAYPCQSHPTFLIQPSPKTTILWPVAFEDPARCVSSSTMTKERSSGQDDLHGPPPIQIHDRPRRLPRTPPPPSSDHPLITSLQNSRQH